MVDFDKFRQSADDDFLKKAGIKFKNVNAQGPIVLIVLAVIALGIIFNSFYTVGPDEVGVIRQFGKYQRTTNPGLNFKIPLLEAVDLVKVKYIFKEEFGFRTTRAGVVSQYSHGDYYDESLMLTGDLNVLVVEWIVQYKVKDAVKVLFNIRNPRRTIRNISEAVMRQVVGDNTVNEVLTTRRVELNQDVQDKLRYW